MELLQRITVHLDDDQHAILSVRLTCKMLEAATFDGFAEKFFHSHHYCILYRVSLLRLYALLASSSRLMSRMRTVTFTACFFANSSYKYVQLALNQSQTDLKLAQIAAMKAYSQDQIEMLQTQMLPDAELIRSVLVALREKCSGVELDLSTRKNARSSIPVHAKVLEAAAVLGIALTRLAVVPTTLASADFGTLESGLSACASSLVKFCFADNNVSMASAESQIPASTRSRLLLSVLGSTNALRDLTLNLAHPSDRWGWGTGGLTSELLLTNLYPMLQSLSLTALPVAERAILNTLANCGGQLEKVNLRVVHLTDIEGDGWADVIVLAIQLACLARRNIVRPL